MSDIQEAQVIVEVEEVKHRPNYWYIAGAFIAGLLIGLLF